MMPLSFVNVNFTMALLLLLIPDDLALEDVVSSRSAMRAGTQPHSDDGERSQTCAPTSIVANTVVVLDEVLQSIKFDDADLFFLFTKKFEFISKLK